MTDSPLIFPERTPYKSNQEQAILERLEGLAGKELYRPRLESIQKCLKIYRPIFPKTRVVIGGTNGKGQVATELAYYLKAHNISHSLLTSPHVLSLTERLSYNGKNISYDSLEYLFEQVSKRFKQQDLSFYELLLLMFMEGHLQHPVDVMITEVGLGGRFDAVNAIGPTMTAIVSIGYDHTEILGPDLKTILEEKLGITRRGVPLWATITQGDLRHFCKRYCLREGIPFYDLSTSNFATGPSYFQRNSLLAMALAQEITGKKGPKEKALSTPGRWETRGRFTFVGAHNIDGLQAMVEDSRMKDFQGIIFSFSERKAGEIKQMVQVLKNCHLPLYFSQKDHFKKLSLDKWPLLQQTKAIKSFYPPSCLGRFLVTGSLYFIGEFQKGTWR